MKREMERRETQNMGDLPQKKRKEGVAAEREILQLWPKLKEQWHPSKNDMPMPDDAAIDNPDPVWWRCDRDHFWRETVAGRIRSGLACPYCANKKVWTGFNDLQTVFPEIADQWHVSLNSDAALNKTLFNSTKKVWWICKKGHIWRASVQSRTKTKDGAICPVCAGRIRDIGGVLL